MTLSESDQQRIESIQQAWHYIKIAASEEPDSPLRKTMLDAAREEMGFESWYEVLRFAEGYKQGGTK